MKVYNFNAGPAVLPSVVMERAQKEFCDYLQYRHAASIMADRVHPGRIGSMIIARAFLRAVGFDREVI